MVKRFSELGATVGDRRKIFNCHRSAKRIFPFFTVIKTIKCGKGEIYQFT